MTAHLIASNERRGVLGLGVTGCSVARWWRSQGCPFIALDTRPEMADSLTARQAAGPDTPLYFGDLDPALVEGLTELVVSPGIALDHPLVAHAAANGVRILGDIDLFVASATAPVVGITGSNGKSTVTALLAAMIEGCGKRVAAGGNLGTPALDLLETDPDFFVLELSSFQLERSEPLNLAAATVLNISADHLDRHGSLPQYHQAKHRIFRGASAVVANRSDPLTLPMATGGSRQYLWVPSEPDLGELGIRSVAGEAWICSGLEPLLALDRIALKGRHNHSNALAALALGMAVGLPVHDLLSGLEAFRGLPHRCELVLERDGVSWINDSKATNVASVRSALAGLGGQQNVVLIAGGVGKEQEFDALQPEVEQHCRRVLTLGEAARDIELALAARTPVQRVGSLQEAVLRAREVVLPGDVVLLSPACASFDMFDSFEARGELFREAVLTTQEQPA